MKCKVCAKWFPAKHFNQKLCSLACKKTARRVTLAKFKHSVKGYECEMRWRKSPNKKKIDRKYHTSPGGRRKAVERVKRLIATNPYYLERKRMGQRAGYRKLRAELIAKFTMCFSCHSEENLTIDHIKPLSLGGQHQLENIQVLCRSCNARKGQETIRYAVPQVQQDIN